MCDDYLITSLYLIEKKLFFNSFEVFLNIESLEGHGGRAV